MRSRRFVCASLYVVAFSPVSCTHARVTRPSPAACSSSDYRADVDSAIRAIAASYVYLGDKRIDWPLAVRVARQSADSTRSKRELVGVLERLLDNLYDAHAIVRANTAHSPRLVPSGLDLWAEWRDSTAIVPAVRPGFNADRHGVRPGMRVLAINGVPIAAVADARLGAAVMHPPAPDAIEWALLSALAGRHDTPRILRIRDALDTVRNVALDADDQRSADMHPAEAPVEFRRIAAGDGSAGYGYIRINALGDSHTVAAFDSALTALRDAPGLLLDLRNTPEGGNTDVAEPILGRFITKVEGYQRVIPRRGAAYTRTVAPRGPWTYTAPVVVLVSRWTGSMGEGMAIAFDGMGRGIVVGTRMAGLAGAVDDVLLPCSKMSIAFPAARLLHVNGTARERWAPPVLVDLAAEAKGEDLILERGIQELRARTSR